MVPKHYEHFYRAKLSVARYCHDKLSVRPSCPSVTLVDCDHTRWNSAKIISWVISLGTWLSADGGPRHHGSTPKGTPLNFSPNRSGVGKKWHAGEQKRQYL